MIREPVVAGQFYPASANLLKKEVAGYIDEGAEKTKAFGAVVPHAGYIYSGETAGAVYSRLVLPPTVVLIGPNHTGHGENYSIQVEGSWKMPFGEVQIDSVLAKEILESSRYFGISEFESPSPNHLPCGERNKPALSLDLIRGDQQVRGYLVKDDAAHEQEHSIEVQIPFLQYLREDVKIVPIILSHAGVEVCRNLGKSIAAAISCKRQDTLVIASSDMTHYESADRAKEKDEKAIHAIVNLDEEELISCIGKFHISMCGYIPSAVMIAACKQLGAKKAELVKYTNSGEKSGDSSQVVGYAGIIITN